MTIRNKAIIWISAGFIGLAVIGLFYWYFSRSTPTSTQTDTNLPRGTVDTSSGGSVRTPATEAGGDAQDGSSQEPFLFLIHDKPIVSSVTFMRKTGPVVRFMEQGSGNVYEYDFTSKQKARVSNTSIPQIARAVWSVDGSVVAFQYSENDVVHTAVGYLASTTGATDAPFDKIFFLPEGIRSVALSPDGKQVAYTTVVDNAGALFTANSNGTSPKVLFASPLIQWSVSWPAASYLLLSSGFGEDAGITYKIDVPSGKKTTLLASPKIFEGVVGDTKGQFIAPDPLTGKVSLYDSKFGTFSKLAELTWADKCSLVQNATSTMLCGAISASIFSKYTAWLRGEFASNDILVATNFANNYKQVLIPENEFADKKFDMVNVSATPDRKYAVFKNRIDGFLWGVRAPGGIE